MVGGVTYTINLESLVSCKAVEHLITMYDDLYIGYKIFYIDLIVTVVIEFITLNYIKQNLPLLMARVR